MLVRNLERQSCFDLLERVGFGRLGCVNNQQPYVVPIYFALESQQLFAFSTEGQKIRWMRENPLVCVQADEIKCEHEWASVLVKGRFEELPANRQHAGERLHARALLEKRSLWWRLAIASSQTRDRHLPVLPIFYCIHIDEISGHRESLEQDSLLQAPPADAKLQTQPLAQPR
jgi:nitroimidazol reductase NimA-like FMN-containing flavoprotein (pyridoxamine 5'-phosphate oxidase superfamily)